jgi:hypothetical protein
VADRVCAITTAATSAAVASTTVLTPRQQQQQPQLKHKKRRYKQLPRRQHYEEYTELTAVVARQQRQPYTQNGNGYNNRSIGAATAATHLRQWPKQQQHKQGNSSNLTYGNGHNTNRICMTSGSFLQAALTRQRQPFSYTAMATTTAALGGQQH